MAGKGILGYLGGAGPGVRRMGSFGKSSLLVLFCGVLGAQAPADDPVQKVRAERAKAQGIAEGDLPPVPRGIVEPPPLPPPETHLKDTPHGRVAHSSRHGAAAKGAKATRTAKTHKHPAKPGRKSSKKVKA